MTKAQKIFSAVVEAEKDLGHLYCFHNKKTVSVDGFLSVYLNEQLALAEKIDKRLKRAGYFLENINGTDFEFVEL